MPEAIVYWIYMNAQGIHVLGSKSVKDTIASGRESDQFSTDQELVSAFVKLKNAWIVEAHK